MSKTTRPQHVIFPARTGKTKIDVLAYGFRLLGIQVVMDPALLKQAEKGRIYPIDFLYEGGRASRAWFDITASRYFKRFDLVGGPNDFYFKTHLARSDAKKDPRICAMPQAVSSMRYFECYQDLRKLRSAGRDFDYDVIAMFVNSDDGLRQKTVERLHAMKDIRILAKMIEHPRLQDRPTPPPEISGSKLRYAHHLTLQAKSKICLALPGAWKNGGASISFRHSEVWGIGGVIASIRPGTKMVGNPGNIWIEFKKDLSDFEDKIYEYLEDDKKREAMGRESAKYWDAVHHPRKVAAYMMDRIGRTI